MSRPALQSLRLTNFKPYGQKIEIPLAPVTLIYGPNSAGKSSIIQSLLLMKQTVARGDGMLQPQGEHIDLGSFASLIHKHDSTRSLDVGLRFRPAGEPKGSLLDQWKKDEGRVSLNKWLKDNAANWRVGSLDLELSFKSIEPDIKSSGGMRRRIAFSIRKDSGVDLQLPFETSFETSFSQEIFSEAWGIDRKAVFRLTENGCHSLADAVLPEIQKRQEEFLSSAEGTGSLTDEQIRSGILDFLQEVESECKGRLFPEELEWNGIDGPSSDYKYNEWENFLQELEFFLQDLAKPPKLFLAGLQYVGPLRSRPLRVYQGENDPNWRIRSDGTNWFRPLVHQASYAKRVINEWFKEFKLGYKISIDEIGSEVSGAIYTASLVDQGDVKVTLADAGFGLSQLLPIMVSVFADPCSAVCVEQPELHLHPRLQAQLADYLACTAGVMKPQDIAQKSEELRAGSLSSDDRAAQWIVETHSELLIMRLQRRIRERKLSHQDISVLYVDRDENGSYVQQLRLDEDGEFIDDWPDGFFDDGFQELYPRS